MRKALLCVLFSVLLSQYARAQDPYEYYYNNTRPDESASELTPDMGLFFAPLGRTDLFRAFSEFNFSAVKYNRRGYSGIGRDYWGSVDFSGLVSRSADYMFTSALRRGNASRSAFADAYGYDWESGWFAGVDEYPTDAGSLFIPGFSAAAFNYNRRGRLGGRVSLAGNIGKKGYAGIAAHRRWGRDPNIDGVFTEETSALAGMDWSTGKAHRISLLIGVTHAENGLRSYAVREAFELTGDNYYNPSWGYYGGEQKSSKTFGKLNFFPVLSYSGRISGSTTVSTTAFLRHGTEKRGGLSWFGAQTPYPDYYRYMPGYEPSNIAENWRANDTRVTQIYWEQLVEQNLGRAEQAAYILADRVEATDYLQFALTGETQVDKNFTLKYGARYHDDSREYYCEMVSLLGARPMPDVDQYLLDDDIFGDYTLNDKRNPGRTVDEGDRFGYNYRLTATKAEAYATLRYEGKRFRAGTGIEIGHSSLQREGYYEKELFPANGSYGKSAKYEFNPYNVTLAAEFSASARHFITASASAGEAAPYAGTVFLNPDYSNTAISAPRSVGFISAEAGYSMVLSRLMLNFSAFASRTSHESAVYRYWDDIEAAYSDMSLSGIDKLYYGVELAGQWEVSPRFTFNFAASLGSYTYDSDPDVTTVNDATRHVVVAGSKSYLSGYNLATTPQYTMSGEVRYSSWGWIASLTANYMGGRYVDVSPLRRMERVYGLAESPEKRADFLAQEQLDDALTLNLFVLRSFRVKKGSVTALLSVNNLLGATDIVYNGYEQMRITKTGSAPNYNWKPFPSKYLYSYGRTYYVSLTYSF